MSPLHFFGFWKFFVPFLIHFVYLFDIIKISMFFLSLISPLISLAWHCFLLNVQHQNEWTQNRVLSRYLKIKLCHFALHFCWLFLILYSSRYLQMFFQSLFNEILQFQFFFSCEAGFFRKSEMVRCAIGLLNSWYNYMKIADLFVCFFFFQLKTNLFRDGFKSWKLFISSSFLSAFCAE